MLVRRGTIPECQAVGAIGGVYAKRPVKRTISHCIIYDIRNELHDARTVAIDFARQREVRFHNAVGLSRNQFGDHYSKHRFQIDGGTVERQTVAKPAAGQIHDAVDQLRHAGGASNVGPAAIGRNIDGLPGSTSAYSLTRLSRSALPMTLTEERAIAAAANIGESITPNTGNSTPAAIGMPAAL